MSSKLFSESLLSSYDMACNFFSLKVDNHAGYVSDLKQLCLGRKILCKAYLHVVLVEPKEPKMRGVVTAGFPVREKWARSSSFLLLFSRCTLLIATGSSIVTLTSAMIIFIRVYLT